MDSSLRFKLATVFSLIFVVGLAMFSSMRLTTHAANATITLSVNSGPPTTVVAINGSGFGSSETVTIVFDTTSVGTKMTDSTGAFFKQITVPSLALPGNHTMLVTGRTSGVSAQAVFQVSTTWGMYGFNSQHTFFNPYENVLNSSNVSALVLAWHYKALGSNYLSTLAEANGLLYIDSSDDTIRALNAMTGKLVWSYSNTPYFFTDPAVVNGVVYAGSADGKLYALNATTGALVWSYSTGSSIYDPPTVANGIVYFSSDKLYALDTSTDTLLWSYTNSTTSYFSSPVVANGILYVGSDKLYAFNALTGASVWSYSIGSGFGSPAVANGIVYACTNKTLYALGALAGTLKWQHSVGLEISSSPAVANGLVYLNTFHQLIALNAQGGKLLWVFHKGSFKSRHIIPSFSPLVVANGVAYVDYADGHGDWLYAVDVTTGNQLWSHYKKDIRASYPMVANGFLYVGSDKLYAYHLLGTTP